jgi:hypothetical protein
MDYQYHPGNRSVPITPVDHLVPLPLPLALLDDHYLPEHHLQDQEDTFHPRNESDLNVAMEEMDYAFFLELLPPDVFS